MEHDLKKARKILDQSGYTCVLVHGTQIRSSNHRGVRPLLDLLDSGESLCGFCAADKVVGKATAFLYVLLGVRAVYARVVSVPAAQVLEAYGIQLEYGSQVDAIANRDKTGLCPMESAVRHIEEPTAALNAVRDTLRRLQNT